MSNTVAVQDLCVGMFVHLDLGWMRHPFPLSSFRIVSQDQIETIRALGLEQLRWAPDKSQLDGAAAAGDMLDPTPEVVAPPAPETPAEGAARVRREQLNLQRQATRQCERQYVEVAQALRGSHLRTLSDPEGARTDTEALSQALLDKMMVDAEICVRLLTSSAGDRASAHALNVTIVSMLMARTMGLPEDEMQALGVGALLHDIGKLQMAERLRHVDERFSAADLAAYQGHVASGVEIGRRMGLDDQALMVLAQHHELADGSGFPLKLGSERMTPASRIVALVNRYDNLCNPQLQTRALTPHEALALLFAQHRTRYDAPVLNTFIRMMGVYPAGSVVQLTDDRFGMVISVNSSRPLKPRVLVHDPKVPRDEALFLDLESVPQLGIRRSLNADKLPAAARDYLGPRPRVNYFFEALAPSPVDEAV